MWSEEREGRTQAGVSKRAKGLGKPVTAVRRQAPTGPGIAKGQGGQVQGARQLASRKERKERKDGWSGTSARPTPLRRDSRESECKLRFVD